MNDFSFFQVHRFKSRFYDNGSVPPHAATAATEPPANVLNAFLSTELKRITECARRTGQFLAPNQATMPSFRPPHQTVGVVWWILKVVIKLVGSVAFFVRREPLKHTSLCELNDGRSACTTYTGSPSLCEHYRTGVAAMKMDNKKIQNGTSHICIQIFLNSYHYGAKLITARVSAGC